MTNEGGFQDWGIFWGVKSHGWRGYLDRQIIGILKFAILAHLYKRSSSQLMFTHDQRRAIHSKGLGGRNVNVIVIMTDLCLEFKLIRSFQIDFKGAPMSVQHLLFLELNVFIEPSENLTDRQMDVEFVYPIFKPGQRSELSPYEDEEDIWIQGLTKLVQSVIAPSLPSFDTACDYVLNTVDLLDSLPEPPLFGGETRS